MNLRDARERVGLSQYDAARIIGVQQPNISLWETGKTRPKINKWQRIGEAYGLTRDQVFAAMIETMEATQKGEG